jgi:hypothetical protein
VATIILTSFVIRHPVGGVLSNNLQFLTGFARLGHEVYLFEKAGYDDSCFDPDRRVSGDDCSAGIRRTAELLARHGLDGRWCYVDASGGFHGMTPSEVETVAARADLFIDRGMHRAWDREMADVPLKVHLDPDPGFRQVKMAEQRGRPDWYDAHFTYGHNIGSSASSAPDLGIRWGHLFHPIDTSLYLPTTPPTGAAFTTVMNWRPLDIVSHEGRTYGMKDVQFEHFLELPAMVSVPLQVAVEGRLVPRERLTAHGWEVIAALDVTTSYEAFHQYVSSSLAEFSVVKDVYHGLRVGWFSDRSAAYLAHGRPVVVQDNGVSAHLPTGDGLFEVSDLAEAAAAIEEIAADPVHHGEAARSIAEEYLDAAVVLRRFLDQLGIPSPTSNSDIEGKTQ